MNITPFVNQRAIRFLKWIFLLLVFYIVLSYFFGTSQKTWKHRKKAKTMENFECPMNFTVEGGIDERTFKFHKNNGTDEKVLLIMDSMFSRHGKMISQVLTALKIPFKSEAISKNLPVLTTSRKGRYSLIVIENYYKYLNMARWNRQILDKYCREYNVPVISFISSKPDDDLKRIRIRGSSLWMWQNQAISSMTPKPSIIHKITKIGTTRQVMEMNDWVLFEQTSSFETVIAGKIRGRERAVVIRDKGVEDGVNRVLFGRNISDWTMKMTFIDSIMWAVGSGKDYSLDRFIQVDIDDVFVGAVGTRMVEDDVNTLISSQIHFRQYIQNFTFMLGFSGSYFRNGDGAEDAGDEWLVENARKFVWFPHMWRHNHAHEHNFTYLEAIMAQNKVFAETMRFPVSYPYAIAPQHDGVFPVHEQMYDAWKKIWNVSVTATEEYPHFKPPSARKAFIHKGISVLPRQTCGLYTHTQKFDNYPEGFDKMRSSIEGGDLFFTILLNPISIFMTHQQNYAYDRLAIYTFESLFRFLKCWTNLRLKWQDPVSSARMYFRKFPEEKAPVWTNPCSDPRHRVIIPPSIVCRNMKLPNLLVLGPQKTGSTALGNFLSIHPNVSQNDQVPGSFEEVQFFGGANYQKGIEWYLSFFRNSSGTVSFEKSATYFDNPLAAKQAAALVPDAKVVVILHDPSSRAYSWFQHVLAHGDPSAVAANDLEVILDSVNMANSTWHSDWKKIRQRCISGGRYIHHLDKWLEYYSLGQIHFIDSDELRVDPVKVLNRLARWLDLPDFDFEKYIRYSPSKGFYCRILEDGKKKCLGGSKGRKYPIMSDSLRRKLNKIFEIDNSSLYKFLSKNRLDIPSWLENTLKNKIV